MQLGGQRGSSNVEDRRGIGVGGGVGIGTIVIAVVAYFLGIDPSIVLEGANQIQQQRPQEQATRDPNAPKDEMQVFVEKVLGSTEDVWNQILPQQGGQRYQEPGLVLFSGAVRSACGMGQSAMGPFYCPPDSKVYIDLAFYRDLRERFRAPGDFAQAYVIAHEVGHHVQNQLGIMQKLQALQGRVSKQELNQSMVRVELQADCFAGVWAHHAGNAKLLDPGDLEEGLTAAAAIGDDRIQKQTQGTVVPESFTHGSSAQRVRWFKRGMETGRMQDCDTFNTRVL
jgi:predicted metalloprotease